MALLKYLKARVEPSADQQVESVLNDTPSLSMPSSSTANSEVRIERS